MCTVALFSKRAVIYAHLRFLTPEMLIGEVCNFCAVASPQRNAKIVTVISNTPYCSFPYCLPFTFFFSSYDVFLPQTAAIAWARRWYVCVLKKPQCSASRVKGSLWNEVRLIYYSETEGCCFAVFSFISHDSLFLQCCSLEATQKGHDAYPQ